MLCTTALFSQAEVSGTITYFFNKYQGDKPDVGAKVHLIDSLSFSKIENSNLLMAYNLLETTRSLVYYKQLEIDRIKSDPELKKQLELKSKLEKKDRHLQEKNKQKYSAVLDEIETYKNKIQSVENRMSSDLSLLGKYNASTKTEWEKYCKDSATPLMMIDMNLEKNVKTTTVDGIGRYSLKNIKKGPYYLIFVSNNRTGLTIATISGDFQITKIDVEDEIIDKSYNFKL